VRGVGRRVQVWVVEKKGGGGVAVSFGNEAKRSHPRRLPPVLRYVQLFWLNRTTKARAIENLVVFFSEKFLPHSAFHELSTLYREHFELWASMYRRFKRLYF
jgi:hypothetical protein